MPTTVGQRLPIIDVTILNGSSVSNSFEIPDGLWEMAVWSPEGLAAISGTPAFLAIEGSLDGVSFFPIRDSTMLAAFAINLGANSISTYNTQFTPAGLTPFARLRVLDQNGAAVNLNGDTILSIYLAK